VRLPTPETLQLGEYQAQAAIAALHSDARGLAALESLDPALPRYEAVAAHLHEMAGDRDRAADLCTAAAQRATSIPERDHLTRQSARLRSAT
jgi:hypothetical protein